MPQQRIYELIARQLSGEATPAELEELHTWMRQHGEDQYVHDILSGYWSQHPDLLQEEENDEEERFQRILRATATPDDNYSVTEMTPAKTFRMRRWLSYAAAVVVLAGSTFFIYRYAMGKSPDELKVVAGALSEVVARPGSRSKLVLPDGTQVWLNAKSRITYQSNFNQALREVNLEGEAFFDVTHNAERPFIVHTSGIDIKVLGTAFNVKSYASDETIEATLLRGSIEVVKHNDPAAPKVILRPNEKLVFNKKELIDEADSNTRHLVASTPVAQQTGISVTALPAHLPDSVIKETSWRYNKLDFNGDSFEELAAKLERWHGVHITINNEKLKRYRLRGSFQEETVVQALEALKTIVKFSYDIEGNEVIIK
jgi:transmembrane sensor